MLNLIALFSPQIRGMDDPTSISSETSVPAWHDRPVSTGRSGAVGCLPQRLVPGRVGAIVLVVGVSGTAVQHW
jgi:hypothetical protein